MSVQTFNCRQVLHHAGEIVSLPLIDHDPLRQGYEDERQCGCCRENRSGWADHPEDPRRCWAMHTLTSKRYPSLRIELCCECFDRIEDAAGELPRADVVAGLFDVLAESLGMQIVPRRTAA